MTYYTVCPSCGYKLLKAGDGSSIEMYCPKCGEKMTIEIKDKKITIQKIIAEKNKALNNCKDKELGVRK